MLPNFFIVGAPKTGTTSLYNYLDQHPGIYMSPIKEPCYFASEIRADRLAGEYQRFSERGQAELKEYLRGPVRAKRSGGIVSEWDDYISLFADATDQTAVGEASVCYLWSPTAARNIAARVPDAKIIMILRDPAERAYSQYLHSVASGYVQTSFHDHIEACLASKKEKLDAAYPFLEYGMYYEQVKTYLDAFSRENIKIYFYEDGLAGIVADVLRFLKVDARELDLSRRHLSRADARQATQVFALLRKYDLVDALRKCVPPGIRPALRRLLFRKRAGPALLNETDRRFLRGYYREDVMKLSVLLDRDLSSWLD